jgi:serine/threonine protein kinase
MACLKVRPTGRLEKRGDAGNCEERAGNWETGVIVGTVFYMSPEQLREDRDLDQRTDIYSPGCILYEMLTGAPPYTGPSLREVVTRILRSPVPSVQRACPGVPAGGGTPRQLVRFDDPARQSTRTEWATDGRQFYFSLGDPQSDIFIAELSGLK